MRFDLKGGTNGGSLALYDPGAVEDLLRAPPERWAGRVDAQARAGRFLHYALGGDGDLRLAVWVDEEPREEAARWRGASAKGTLPVPSGRLVFGGLETMRAAPDGTHAFDPALATEHAIPPGTYEAEIFDIEPPRVHAEAREAEVRRRAGALAARTRDAAGTGCGCAGLTLALGGLLLLFVLVGYGREAARESFHAVQGPWIVGVALAMILVNWLPFYRRVDRARAEIDTTWPDTGVVLRRLPDGTQSDRGISFGPGAGPGPERLRAR